MRFDRTDPEPDELTDVIVAAWNVIDLLNPNVPWHPALLELQHALVAYRRYVHRSHTAGSEGPDSYRKGKASSPASS